MATTLYHALERKLRAVIPGDPTFSDWRDASPMLLGDPRPGIAVPVDLESLVSRVWVAPLQGGLLEVVVRGLLEKYDVPVEVCHSNIDDVAWRQA